ncbi:MAG: ABC transporter substrate-binding protein [Actinomycetales bacterium]
MLEYLTLRARRTRERAVVRPDRGTGGLSKLGRPRRTAVAAVSAAALIALAGCASDSTGESNNTITYWLWDSGQQPGYQQCADAFEQQNPDLKINIVQNGWNDYWSKLTAGFIADTAPDVFTDHLSKFAQYVDLDVLYSLDDLEATKDIADDDYMPGLAELWKGQDGKRYGAPKDWDTIAWFYDQQAMDEAGITAEQLATATWNPQDGGTFEQIIAHLTIDANGVRGDEPGFDKNDVEVYGLASNGSGGDGFGQTQWSPFTGSNDWQATNKNPWGNQFNFDDGNFQETMAWYYGLVDKGYMPDYNAIGGANAIGPDKQLQTGMSASGFNGSWMISTYTTLQTEDGNPIQVGLAPTPIGPSGQRASMFNGLADSVTKQAKNPEAAAKWVKFLSGQECQNIIGSAGVVFPARPEGTDLAIAYNADERGLDVSPFTEQVSQGTTFLFPVTSNAADITALTKPTFDAIYIGDEPVSEFTQMNDQLNSLMQVAG